MTPAIFDEVPSAVNTNGPDDVLVEETHLKDMGAEEGAFIGEPDKENVFVWHENGGILDQSTIEDDLFDDESDEDGANDFVPRGKNDKPTLQKAGTKVVPKKVVNPSSSKTDENSDAAAATGNPKDASAQKKNVKTAK